MRGGSAPRFNSLPLIYHKFSSLFVIFCYIGEAFTWFKGGCSFYTIHANSLRVSWEKSRQMCKQAGRDLVSIESNAEWIFLKNTILKLTIANEYFIGLRGDYRSRQWRWLSNKNSSQIDLPWAKGEPNGDGNCAAMYKDYRRDYGKYNDLGCTSQARPGYICEFPVDGCNQEVCGPVGVEDRNKIPDVKMTASTSYSGNH
ncbi:hepatic lectin-like [Orbicella faveolata]|uniref:hepatic lectin-like n=1 Tax=Orbicella faveolata TaxID=48498 RepID=UPI0009E1EA88|nr:hepatic lectin-like [Orbicella faveolata]